MSAFQYVRSYKINPDLLKEIKNLYSDPDIDWVQHQYSVAGVVNNIEQDFGLTEPSISSHLDFKYNSLSFNVVADALHQYYEEFPCCVGTRFLPIRLTRYREQQSMRNHWDGIHTIFDGDRRGVPILSIVGLVRKADEGGKFFMNLLKGKKKEYLVEEGTIVVFPSTFIFEHEVTPVIRGVRDSFVSWTFY
jgi:hypothetical protein